MTVIDFITVFGFTITILSTGIAIGRLIERFLSLQNKNNRPK